MFRSEPVLIVGAGPSGLTMAIYLARRKVPFRLIDIARSATDKSKAMGIQARTLEMFDNLGIADEFVANGFKCLGARVMHEDKQLVHIRFDHLASPFPFILTIPQSETERILTNLLEKLGGSVEREVRLTDFSQDASGVVASIEQANGQREQVHTPWIIGCDGAHSTVRHTLNLPFQGSEYEEGFVLADVKIDWANPGDELVVYTRDGFLLAAFPLPEGRWRIIADVPPADAPVNEIPALQTLQDLIEQRCPIKAVLSDPGWMANYRIQRRIVPSLREGHAFLVGDAANIHSPAGAQGMNTGIQDALNLSWKLAMVYSGATGEQLLDSYQAERYPVEKAVLVGADLPITALSMKNELGQLVRDKIVRFLAGFDIIQHEIRGVVSEIGVKYLSSPIVEDRALSGGPRAGVRAPDAYYDVTSTGHSSVHKLLRGPEHKLLIFGQNTRFDDYAAELGSVARLVRARLGGGTKVYHVSTGNRSIGELHADTEIDDTGGHVTLIYGAREGAIYLIRPDGYIAFRSSLYGCEDNLRVFLDSAFPTSLISQLAEPATV